MIIEVNRFRAELPIDQINIVSIFLVIIEIQKILKFDIKF